MFLLRPLSAITQRNFHQRPRHWSLRDIPEDILSHLVDQLAAPDAWNLAQSSNRLYNLWKNRVARLRRLPGIQDRCSVFGQLALDRQQTLTWLSQAIQVFSIIKGQHWIRNKLDEYCDVPNGVTPFMIAVSMDNDEFVRQALDIGFHEYSQLAILKWAEDENELPRLRQLFSKSLQFCHDVIKNKATAKHAGITVNVWIHSHFTCLTYAAHTGNLHAVRVLFDAGAQLEMKDKNQLTALGRAIISQNMEIVQYLISKNANVNTRVQGLPALLFAAQKCHLSLFQMLLEAGADRQAMDWQRNNAFHYAIRCADRRLVQVLTDVQQEGSATFELGLSDTTIAAGYNRK